jgi:hypothetical protein
MQPKFAHKLHVTQQSIWSEIGITFQVNDYQKNRAGRASIKDKGQQKICTIETWKGDMSVSIYLAQQKN